MSTFVLPPLTPTIEMHEMFQSLTEAQFTKIIDDLRAEQATYKSEIEAYSSERLRYLLLGEDVGTIDIKLNHLTRSYHRVERRINLYTAARGDL